VRFHTLVDLKGFVRKVVILPANVHDVHGAKALANFVPPRAKVYVDLGYRGENTGLRYRSFHGKSRWVVERTFAWMNRQRRLFGFFERTYKSAEAFIYLFSAVLQLKRSSF
jgi:putative transposase